MIRTGYGIFYTQDIGNAYFDMARNIAGRATAVNVDTTTGIYGNSNLTWANAAPGASGGTTVLLGPTTVEYANAPSHKTSYTQQFLLNIQQQVGHDWSFELGYQGALSRHLYGFKNANQPTPYGYLGTGAQLQSRRGFRSMWGWAQTASLHNTVSNISTTRALAITTRSS